MESAPLIGQWIKSIANKLNDLITYKVEEDKQKEINEHNFNNNLKYNYYVTSTPQKNDYIFSTEKKLSSQDSMIGKKRYRDLNDDDFYNESNKKGIDLITTCRKQVNSNIMSYQIKKLKSNIIKQSINKSQTDYKVNKKLYVYQDTIAQEKKKMINKTFEIIFEERKKKLNEYFKSKTLHLEKEKPKTLFDINTDLSLKEINNKNTFLI